MHNIRKQDSLVISLCDNLIFVTMCHTYKRPPGFFRYNTIYDLSIQAIIIMYIQAGPEVYKPAQLGLPADNTLIRSADKI